MRNFRSHKIAVFFALSLFVGAAVAQDADNGPAPVKIIKNIASFITGTITDIVSGTAKLASDVVQKSVGIDIFKRGYGNRRDHDPVPECLSKDARNEMLKMHADYSREIHQYEEELGQELKKDEDAFEKNVSAEDSRQVLLEKKSKLEKQADEAYARFDGKVNNLNDKFDDKRDTIIKQDREKNSC